MSNERWAPRLAVLAGGYAAVGGGLSLAGWVLNIPRLTDWRGVNISIQPNAALSAALAGAAVLTAALQLRWIARAAAILAACIGGATLSQHLLGLDLRIDTLLMFDRTWGRGQVTAVGRMGLPASTSFLLLGAGVIMTTLGGRWRKVTPVIGMFVLAIAALSLVGYLLGARPLYTIPSLTAISWQTATMTMASALGLIALTPEREPVRMLLEDSAAGALVRRMLPLMVFVPTLLAWVRVQAQRSGLFEMEFGTGVLVIALVGLFWGLLWWSAAEVGRRERGQIASDLAVREGDARLRRKRVQFETLLNAAPVAVQLADSGFRVREANPSATQHFGEGLIGADIRDVIRQRWPQSAADVFARGVEQALATGAPQVVAECCGPGDCSGDEHYYSWQAHRIPMPEGGFGVVCYFNDITDQVLSRGEIERARDALKESETKFRTLADASPAVIWFAGPDGRNVYVNRPFLEYFGKTQEEVMGENWHPLVHPDDKDEYMAAALRAIDERKPLRARARVQRHDGKWRWIESHSLPRFAKDGTYLGHVGFSPDITDLVEAEAEVRRHREGLEKIVEQRTAQLRALTVELTQVEQQERRQLAEFLHDGLQQIIVAAGMHLEMAARKMPGGANEDLKRVAELLQSAVKSSRSLTMELSPPVLFERGLIPALRWLVHHVEQQYGQRVELLAQPDGEPQDADVRVLLFLSVRELLFNARKHAGATRVTVSVAADGDDRVRVEVADDGKGFDPAQAVDAASRGGFGLFAIRERLGTLGGGLIIESAIGEGTRMAMTAPRQREEAAPQPAATLAEGGNGDGHGNGHDRSAAVSNGRVRILIADDHAIIRQGLSLLLRDRNDFEVVGEASDGHEAIAMAKQLNPDVIVMDVTMPGLSGIEATRIITRSQPNVKVIGLSMHSDPQVSDSMIEAGASAFLIKDRAGEDLIAEIQRIRSEAPQLAAR